MYFGRMKVLTWVSISMSVILWSSPTTAQSLPDDYYPESVTVAADGSLYVGSAVEGSIVRVSPGQQSAEPFVEPGANGLMSVQGLLADDTSQNIWVCTADLGVAKTTKSESALLAFDLVSGQAKGRWPLPGGGFCNDIALAADGALLITDTTNPRVLSFDTRRRRFEVWIEHPLLGGAAFNGNGIAVDGKSVFISTFGDGRLIRIPIEGNGRAGTPAALQLPRPLDGGDALRVLAPGRLIVFENGLSKGGGGSVTLIHIHGKTASLSVLASGIAEPTSGVVHDGRLHVAESQFGKLFGAAKGQPAKPFRIVGLELPDLLADILLPDGARYPNGIAHASDGTLYVGFITSGRVLRKQPGAQWETFFSGSDEIYAGTSLRLDEKRGLLWGASPDFLPGDRARPHRIFALDANTGAIRQTVVVPDGGFGNDIALAADGAVYLTDSKLGRVLRLPLGASAFEVVIKAPQLDPVGGIGVGGIALSSDGSSLIVGNYGAGRLYVIDDVTGVSPGLRELRLPRLIENPDGIAFTLDGSLIVLEGAVKSGDGKVLKIKNPLTDGEQALEPFNVALESPVNLSIASDGRILITESRVRHRLIPGREKDVPAAFRIIQLNSH